MKTKEIKPCGVPGCSKAFYSRGFCKNHYRRFIERPAKQKAKLDAAAAEERKRLEAEEEKINAKRMPLTTEQLKSLFLTKCRNEVEAKNFIKVFFGLHLPDCKVSRYADTTPFHAIWEAYDICVNKNNPQNIQELLYVAGRGSGKTLGMAIAELLVLFHDQRDVVHVGAILQQAKRCYEYQQKFLLSDRIRPIIDPPKTPEDLRMLEKTTMERSVFNIKGEKLTLEVIPCTLKSVNGPHVPLVVVDEIDTVKGEAQIAYRDIAGMLDSKRGKKPLRIGISTRKSRYGLMNAAIESAEKQGRHVRRWTSFEFTERCPDSRSTTTPETLWIDQSTFDVRLEEDYEKLTAAKKKEYERHEMFRGCRTCPLAPICLGDAKKQVSKSPMLKTIDELAQKVLSEGPDWALAQIVNLKPSVEGIIYKEFDERVHVKTWNEMWKTLTGKDYPGECDHDTFVKKCQSMGLQAYAGIDWGWSNPHTLLVFYVDSKENVYVVRCDGMTYISRPAWMHHVKTKWHPVYKVQLYFPDLADPGDGVEMRKIGLPVTSDYDKGQINFGIQIIKKWLKVPGNNEPKLFLAQETCQPLIREFNLYHYKTDASGKLTDYPEGESDHWLDALRYPLVQLFGKNNIVLSSAGMDADLHKVVDTRGNFMRPPTAEEYAKANGIPLNSDTDSSKLGKIGRLSEIEADDLEDSAGEGFIWTL